MYCRKSPLLTQWVVVFCSTLTAVERLIYRTDLVWQNIVRPPPRAGQAFDRSGRNFMHYAVYTVDSS